jgi:sulfhydrogenase subunit alpha
MTTKKLDFPIKIDHVARIEGKAGIEVFLEKNKLKEVNVRIFEGPRFFEAITLGKSIEEATAIFPRVCSFCAAAHKITALQAAEKALELTPSDQTKLLRELMYLGDQIESHTLHLFLLALPDFLGYPDAFTMSKDYPTAVKTALKLKDIGANIQKELGSRFMHQENAVIGGFGKLPSESTLKGLQRTLTSLQNDSELALNLFSDFDLWDEVTKERTHLALKPYGEDYTVLGEVIQATDGTEFADEEYRKHILEHVVSHSFAKHSLYKKKPFMTGAISRYTLFKEHLSDYAKELAQKVKKKLVPDNPLANNYAQAVELAYFIEHSRKIIDMILANYKPLAARIKPDYKKKGKGIAVSEAPRGLLAYTLAVDKNGKVQEADIITPTAMFLPLMEADLRRETESMLEQKVKDTKTISRKLETIVRSYDPCVSCSVHVTEVKK